MEASAVLASDPWVWLLLWAVLAWAATGVERVEYPLPYSPSVSGRIASWARKTTQSPAVRGMRMQRAKGVSRGEVGYPGAGCSDAGCGEVSNAGR